MVHTVRYTYHPVYTILSQKLGGYNEKCIHIMVGEKLSIKRKYNIVFPHVAPLMV